MIPQGNGKKADILSAYSSMLMTEAVDSTAKKVHTALLGLIKKATVKDKEAKLVKKYTDAIINPNSDDLDWIQAVVSVGNHLNDRKKHEKELEKILDMI